MAFRQNFTILSPNKPERNGGEVVEWEYHSIVHLIKRIRIVIV